MEQTIAELEAFEMIDVTANIDEEASPSKSSIGKKITVTPNAKSTEENCPLKSDHTRKTPY